MRSPAILDQQSFAFVITGGPNSGMMIEGERTAGGLFNVSLVDNETRQAIAHRNGLTPAEAAEFARHASASGSSSAGA